MKAMAMDRPARLLIWRDTLEGTRVAESVLYPSLDDALTRGGLCLGEPDTLPWIETEAGDLLSPQWIGTYLDQKAAPAEPPRRPLEWLRALASPSCGARSAAGCLP